MNNQTENIWNLYLSSITTKFADFKGTATRKEYWSYILFYTLLSFPIALFIVIGGLSSFDLTWLSTIYQIVFFVPSMAVLVRRMHDAGFSAWWLPTIIIPLIIIFLPTSQNNKYSQNESKPLSSNQKIIFASVISLLCLGTVIAAITTPKQSTAELLPEIAKYQIHTSKQSNMKNFSVQEFSELYAPDCPIYTPFIYYALNPNVQFHGISAQQGEYVYTFEDGRFLNFGFYESSLDGSIKPIYRDQNDSAERTIQEEAEIINERYCTPINNALAKYGHLPIPEVIDNMRKDIWGEQIATGINTERPEISQFRLAYKNSCLANHNTVEMFNALKNSVNNYTAYSECACSIVDYYSIEDINFIMTNGEEAFIQTPRGQSIIGIMQEKCMGL